MKNWVKFLACLFVAGLLAPIAGCGGDDNSENKKVFDKPTEAEKSADQKTREAMQNKGAGKR